MQDFPARTQWVRCLTAVPRTEVEALARRLSELYSPAAAASPRDGLMLLTMRESVRMEMFHLGEIPAVAIHVVLAASDGRKCEGGAVAMDDDVGFVTALAILDGVLAARLPGHEQAAEMVRRGAAERQRVEKARATMLERTRVDFDLLSEADDDAA